MQKVRPAINAINAFKSNVRRFNDNNKKKVTFDLATVSFQVYYDMPDDKLIGKHVPVWTEHWHNSRGNMMLGLLKSITITQWINLIVIVICSVGLIIHLNCAIKQYLRYETIITADYQLPEYYIYPSVTVCLPIIVPIDERCDNSTLTCQQLNVSDIFNKSLSEYSQSCELHEIQGNKRISDNCNTFTVPVESISVYHKRKCFTYFSQISPKSLKPPKVFAIQTAKQSHINIKIRKENNPLDTIVNGVTISVHQANMIPGNSDTEYVSVLAPKHKYEISYRLTQFDFFGVQYINLCHNYSHHNSYLSHYDCKNHCILESLGSLCKHCLTRFLYIRRNLVEIGQKVCNEDQCSLDELSDVEHQCNGLCEYDCLRESFELSVRESSTDNTIETEVIIGRKLVPDLLITYLPAYRLIQFIAILGGISAFWFCIIWFILTVVKLIKYMLELYQLYCIKLN